MSRSARTLCGLSAVLALTLTACADSTDSNGAAGTAAADRPEDSLVLAVGDITESEFDPAKGWGQHNEHAVLHSSLLSWDEDMEMVGQLADSFTQEGTTWTFELNPEYTFSDGEAVTAEDVVFTYEMLKEDGTNFDLSNLREIRAEGEHTVVVELERPDTLFGPMTAQIGIVPAHHYDEDYSADPVASGPYRIVEHQQGEQVLMEANPHYPHDLAYQELTFVLSDEEAGLAAAGAGRVDIATVSHNNADRQIEGMTLHDLESVDTLALTLPTEPAGGAGETMGQEVEVGNDVTADPAIREALTVGLDRTGLSDLVVSQYGEPAYSVADGLPWFTDKVVFDDARVDDAQRILEEAGWSDSNGDGTVDKDGVEAVIPLMYTTNDQVRVDLAESVAVQAEELGIRFEPEGVTWDDVYEEGKTKAVVFALGSLSPKELYDSYSSDSIGVSYNNLPNYSNPEVDEHIDAARAAESFEESLPRWQAAQEAGASAHPDHGDVSMLWLLRRDHLYYVADHVDIGEQIMHGHGHGLQIFMNVEEWS